MQFRNQGAGNYGLTGAHLVEDSAYGAGSIVLVGSGGKGKTTAARIIQASIAHKYVTNKRKFPVDVFNNAHTSLRAYAEQACQFISLFADQELASVDSPVSRTVVDLRQNCAAICSEYITDAMIQRAMRENNVGTKIETETFRNELVVAFSTDEFPPSWVLSSDVHTDIFVSLIESLCKTRESKPQGKRTGDPSIILGKSMLAVAKAIHKKVGVAGTQLSEMGIADDGVIATLHRHDKQTYVISIGEFEYHVRGMKHSDIAFALSFAFATRISSLGTVFAEDIKVGAILSGGLSESVPLTIQMINDLTSKTGAIPIVELRDDFDKGNSNDTFGSSDLSDNQRRLIASSRVAFYFTEVATGYMRVRAYDVDEIETLESNVRIDIEAFRSKRFPYIHPTLPTAQFPNTSGTPSNWQKLKKMMKLGVLTKHSF